MRTYSIIGKTNSWIAQRDPLFHGETEITLKKGLTLREARQYLLDFFCNEYDCHFPNWGSAMNSNLGRDYACRYPDGTYSYQYDSRTYSIQEEEWHTYNYAVELNGKVVEQGEISFRDEQEEQEFIEQKQNRYEDSCDDCVEVLFR